MRASRESALRKFLEDLESAGDLLTIREEVDARYEASAILKRLDIARGPAVLFEQVKGLPFRVVGNLLGTRARLARALGVEPERLHATYLERKAQRIPVQETSQAAVHEIVVKDQIDVSKLVPALTYHEGDAGPYITAGVCIARDPDGGAVGMGIHRIQVRAGSRLGILLVSRPIGEYFIRAEQRGVPLPVVIAIGLDPATLFGAVAWVPAGDKLQVAGAMRGEALRLTRGLTVDVPVPADAELSIEGQVLPGVREKEGPFGETSGYSLAYDSPVLEVSAVTRRHDAIFHAIHPMSADTFMLLGPAWEAEYAAQLRSVSPRVRTVHLTPESCCSHAIVSVEKMSKAEARSVGLALANVHPQVKQVTVVDADIDPFNPQEVAWAIATRAQPDRDLIVLSDLPGSVIDPSAAPGSVTAKHVLDATYPTAQAARFQRIRVPRGAEERAAAILHEYLQRPA